MKVSVAVLSIFMVMAFSSLASSGPQSVMISPFCCYKYHTQIPRHRVKSYAETSSQCSKPAVLFKTKSEKNVCANPRDSWVQEYINYLNQDLTLQEKRLHKRIQHSETISPDPSLPAFI